MSTQNLWGELPATEIVRTPVQILKEQASALTQMTKGVLVGVVTNSSSFPNYAFIYEMGIKAPALNNYSITVLAVGYELHMYPLSVHDELGKNPKVECQNEAEFLAALQAILQGAEIRRAISSLIVQSNGVAALTSEEKY